MNRFDNGRITNDWNFFVNFNQDFTCLLTGTEAGYRLYSLNSVDKLDKIYDGANERILLIERLFSTSLIAVVGVTLPCKLRLWHLTKGMEISNYIYPSAIVALKLNKQDLVLAGHLFHFMDDSNADAKFSSCLAVKIHRPYSTPNLWLIVESGANVDNHRQLVVCLEDSIYIHRIGDMHVSQVLTDIAQNVHGVCALSIGCLESGNASYLAYPSDAEQGLVHIFDTVSLKIELTVHAHNNQLACMAFNSSGTMLSTASIRGTVIRVFSIPDGAKLFEFRRGMKRYSEPCANEYTNRVKKILCMRLEHKYATIYSLTFSIDSLFLACSSNTETVHVFKLDSPEVPLAPAEQGWMDYFGKALKTSASYLPASEFLLQGRDYAVARLPVYGCQNVCAIVNIEQLPRLLLASRDGSLYIFNLDPLESNYQCTLVKHHRLDASQHCVNKMSSCENDDGGKQTCLDDQCNTVENDDTESMMVSYSSVSPLPKWGGPTKLSYASVVMTTPVDSYDWQSREERELNHAAATDCGGNHCGDKKLVQRDASLHLHDDDEFPAITAIH